jgi:HAMP domain-containing protein
MTIRSRFLRLLAPFLVIFFALMSGFLYFNWSREFLQQHDALALLGIKMNAEAIHQKLHQAAWVIGMAALVTFACVILTVFFIAESMSRPIRQLNQAALEIAAGHYDTNIQIQGPKEVNELSHTLNTMSQCLIEQMSRLQKSSLIRERMCGEYECALLLQDYMLQKVIDNFHNPFLKMGLICGPMTTFQKGLFLKIDVLAFPSDLKMTLLEAHEVGFAGLFLLAQCAHLPIEQMTSDAWVECQFFNHYTSLHHEQNHLFAPLVWSIKFQRFIQSQDHQIPLNNQDMVFLCNSHLIEHFETEEKLKIWLGRVLRHFAEDGLNSIRTMLTHELTFLAKKQQIKKNFQMISMQIKNIF